MAEKRNPAVVCCRTVSMIMIVLCHIIGFYSFIPGHGFLGQVFNVGVFSFLAISGYLYGRKNITDWPVWFRKRCTTVLIPALCLTVVVMFIRLCSGKNHDGISMMLYLLNLQGLGFLIPGVYRWFREVEVLGPLWFITVIMLCYCLVPALQKLRSRICGMKHRCLAAAGATVIAFAVLVLSGVNVVYFLTFAVGYYLAAKDSIKQTRWVHVIALSGFMLTAQVIRLLLWALCDGTPLYQGYTQISQMVLGIWILCAFLWMGECLPGFIGMLAEQKLVATADKLSFYVYLTHCCFCRGTWNFYERTDNILLATVGFAVATLFATIILKKIATTLQRYLDR